MQRMSEAQGIKLFVDILERDYLALYDELSDDGYIADEYVIDNLATRAPRIYMIVLEKAQVEAQKRGYVI